MKKEKIQKNYVSLRVVEICFCYFFFFCTTLACAAPARPWLKQLILKVSQTKGKRKSLLLSIFVSIESRRSLINVRQVILLSMKKCSRSEN